MDTAGMMTVAVDREEEVRWAIPVRNLAEPVRILVDVCVIQEGRAQVELSLGGEQVVRSVRFGERVVLETKPVRVGAEAEIVMTTRGEDTQSGVRWSNLRYALDDRVFPVPVAFPLAAETIPPPVASQMPERPNPGGIP